MASNDTALIFTRVPGVREELLEDEMLLYLPSNPRAICLNSAAATVWALCDGSRTAGEIISMLVETYPDSEAEIPSQVHEALRELSDLEVLVPGEAA